MEQQPEILQNGFTPEEDDCEKCDLDLAEKPQDPKEEATSCPVVPKRAALLYPSTQAALRHLFLRIQMEGVWGRNHSTVGSALALHETDLDSVPGACHLVPQAPSGVIPECMARNKS